MIFETELDLFSDEKESNFNENQSSLFSTTKKPKFESDSKYSTSTVFYRFDVVTNHQELSHTNN